ncbi:MATE family efflux transporter [bacterium]|nr:MATE family efflux transporter [bacterium]
MMLHLLLGVADIAMVGRLGGDALAATGFARTVIMVLFSLFMGYSQATNALVARYIGAKDPERAQKAAFHALLFSSYIGCIVSILTFLTMNSILAVLSLDDNVRKLTTEYITVYAAFLIVVPWNFILNGIFQGMGRTKIQFYVMGGANILNIILNYFLIFGDQYIDVIPIAGLGLGVKGAALATVISRLIGITILVFILQRKKYKVHLKFFSFKPSWEFIRPLNIIGLPSAMQGIGRNVAMIMIFDVAARTSIGMNAMAALTVGIQAEAFAFMPVLGLTNGTMSMVGQNLGAKKIGRAQSCAWEGARLAVYYLVPWSAIFVFFAVPLVKIFTNDPNVIYPAATYLITCAIPEVFLCALPLMGALRSAGDAIVPLAINLLSYFMIRVPFSYLLALYTPMDYIGIWWAINIAMAVQCLLIILRFRQGVWKRIEF